MVVGAEGSWRFQTGMVTAALLSRGLSMAQAFEGSATLRDELRGRKRIRSEDLESRIDDVATEVLGHEPQPPTTGELPRLRLTGEPAPVVTDRLLRYAVTAGLTPDQALDLVRQVDEQLRRRGLGEDAVDGIVEELLDQQFGARAARRFALTAAIRQARQPVVILIGGATGAGKSSLATELAFRLGISLVTSTDMVRETMRSVLSREVVPGLHEHSFRGMVLGGHALSDPREKVLAGFRQQADQVAVGVRAIIRRAAREASSMVIEGTHLVPPFRHYLPADASVIMAGLLLAVPSEKSHAKRFPRRAALARDRAAQDYLDAFQSVRWIHDELLSEAEESDELVVAGGTLDDNVDQAIEVLSRALEFAEPAELRLRVRTLSPRTLFLILDGLADKPSRALGGKTPLAAARKETIGILAAHGGQGRVQTSRRPGEAPETDEGMLALLAAPSDGDARLGRGMLEALGLGVGIPPDAVVLRGNLATRKGPADLVDRRAGRIRSGTSDLLIELRDVALAGGIRGSIQPAHEHRVVVMLRGPGLSAAVADTDPGSHALDQRVRPAVATDEDPASARTAAALQELLDRAARHLAAHPLNAERQRLGRLPANCVITRGAASAKVLPRPSFSPTQAALVAGCSTALGVARAAGLQPVRGHGMTANLDTDIDAKFDAAVELLGTRGLVVVHLKGTDIAAHDRRPLEKRSFIERVDAALGRMLRAHPELSEDLRIVLSADHGTDSNTGDHLADPVPLLVSRWRAEDADAEETASFDEDSAQSGALGLLQPGQLHDLLWSG